MGVDVLVCDVVDGVGLITTQVRFSRLKRGYGRALRSQDNVVDLALTGSELSRGRKSASNVGGVERIFPGGIDHDDISRLNWSRIVGIVENGGVKARADDGSIGRTFATTFTPFVLHQGGNFAFVHARLQC